MLLFVLLSRFLMNENSKCCLIKINKEKNNLCKVRYYLIK